LGDLGLGTVRVLIFLLLFSAGSWARRGEALGLRIEVPGACEVDLLALNALGGGCVTVLGTVRGGHGGGGWIASTSAVIMPFGPGR
jgi:hypothetical protein